MMDLPTSTPQSDAILPCETDYNGRVEQQAWMKRGKWGRVMSSPVLREKLEQAVVDYKHVGHGQGFVSLHMPQ